MAQSIAVEARASYNMFSKEGEYGDHTCLSLFALSSTLCVILCGGETRYDDDVIMSHRGGDSGAGHINCIIES